MGFAFAAAELLAEIDAARHITFAAGGYRQFFAEEPERFCGRPLASLVAAEDQPALELAMATLQARGRLAPVELRLADQPRSAIALSGLALPDRQGIAWLTFARLPGRAEEPAGFAAGRQLRDALGSATPGTALGLVEIGNWQDLHQINQRALQDGLAGVLRDAGGAASLTAALAPGRFGVLAASLDMAELQHAVLRMLHAAGVPGKLATAHLPLAAAATQADSDLRQALRAMRFAVMRFAEGGVQALDQSGFSAGLRGFLAQAEDDAASLRRAIAAQRFRLNFQPVVDLASRKLHHFEALLRPNGLLTPSLLTASSFVGFAEAMGMAELLDQAVLARVITALRGCDAHIAVNLSGLSLQSPGFAATLLDSLRAAPDLARRLLVEITETAEIEDIAAATAAVENLCALGVRSCLDDFGAGAAAFRYLRQFRVDFVKIDGAYVRDGTQTSREAGFVGPMVELARCAGAAAIAEMVESEAQALRMQALGVQLGQGFLFGKPGALPGTI